MTDEIQTEREMLLDAAKRIVLCNRARDFRDFAMLSNQLGYDVCADVLLHFNQHFPMHEDTSEYRRSAYQVLIGRLVMPRPVDLEQLPAWGRMANEGPLQYWCNVEHDCDRIGPYVVDQHYPISNVRRAAMKVEAFYERNIDRARKFAKRIERER